MAFIKAQNLVYEEDGSIKSGSASIVDTVYINTGTYHSKQVRREKLGKVVYLREDKHVGIFLSPTRGLVQYSTETDTFEAVEKDDPRIRGTELFPAPEVHTIFGDTYLLLKFLEQNGFLEVLQAAFPQKKGYERLLCHILHGVIRDGTKVPCDNFIDKSFASYIVPDIPIHSLRSDTVFFTMMGNDQTRIAFFQSFVRTMRKKDPAFGIGCYVDSTPLPNDIVNNPFNALCSHGVSSCEVMTRLVLVLDERSGLPVWYDIIPGNILDINTLMTVVEDVSCSLNIEIDSLVLDAGYVSKELITAYNIGTEKTFIGRMPARKGYPHKSLYTECKDLIGKGKYSFVRQDHAYFGKRKEIEIFGQKEYAYVYVDKYSALKRYSEYLRDNQEEYDKLEDDEKDWYMVRFGYFVLLSNIDATPQELLSDYFGRTQIETVFKTSKEYLDLLPLSKWSDTTVRGKILSDIINTIVMLQLRKAMHSSGYAISDLFTKTQSLMCFRNKTGTITVEPPNRMVKEFYKLLKITVPSHLKLKDFISAVYGPNM